MVDFSLIPEEESQVGFAIIIPVYNGEKTLPDTLLSIVNLEGEPYELIVVDDASTDRSAAVAQAQGARLVSLPQNRGPATARNAGAHAARSEYLLFTDSDVLVPKATLTHLRQMFLTTQADAVQGTFSEVCPFPNYFSQYKNLYNRYVLNQLPDWIDTTFTSITAVKRPAFVACGGFDENIRGASVEDRTLGKNLRDRGFSIYMDRTLEVIHNKRLTLRGFIRNQFRRSRDLVKLMLRNRQQRPTPPTAAAQPDQPEARFGTNSLATMVRIPVFYAMLFFGVAAIWQSIFWVIVVFLGIIYLHLIYPFELYLLRKRGLNFALKGIPVNLLDAGISGLGILSGLTDFFLRGKRY